MIATRTGPLGIEAWCSAKTRDPGAAEPPKSRPRQIAAREFERDPVIPKISILSTR
jgi:hypothetical protein